MTLHERLPYILLMIFVSAISGIIAFRAYRSRRKVARADPFAMMALSGSFWMILVALNILNTSLAWREVLWRILPLAILSTLTGLFFFSLEFSLRLKRVPKSILYPTIILPLLITILYLTNNIHHQMWTVLEVKGNYVEVMGSFFTIQLVYTYLLAFCSLVLLVRAYLLSKGILRKQTILLLVGILIPIMVSIFSDVYGWNPLPFIDLPALSTGFTVILFGWATLRFNNIFLLPVASDVVIKNMLDGVLVTDVEGLNIYSNPAARQILGKTEAQLNGIPVTNLLAGWQTEALHAWEDGKEDVQLIVGEGEPQYFRLKISKLAGNSDEAIGSLLTLYNNTDQKNYEKRLNELAICDPLTGCYNRRYFFEMVHVHFNQMMRTTSPLSILMFDLDHFKSINDTYGHLKGDLVLQNVSSVCKTLVRNQDVFSRYGGEEFILAMPETPLQNALIVAERLRRAIEVLNHKGVDIPVTASIGVVETAGEAGLALDTILNRADEAMYHSKKTGRNRVSAWEKR